MAIGPSVEFKRRKRKAVLWRVCGAAAILLAIVGGWALLTWKKYEVPGAPHGVSLEHVTLDQRFDIQQKARRKKWGGAADIFG
jgi:hypothetical protein